MQKNTFLHSYSDNSDSIDGIFDHASLLPASRMFWKGNFLNFKPFLQNKRKSFGIVKTTRNVDYADHFHIVGLGCVSVASLKNIATHIGHHPTNCQISADDFYSEYCYNNGNGIHFFTSIPDFKIL